MEIFLLLILSGILRVIWILGDVLNIKNIRRKNWGALCFMREAKHFVHFFFFLFEKWEYRNYNFHSYNYNVQFRYYEWNIYLLKEIFWNSNMLQALTKV